jgi:hypothetical protein
VLLKGQALVAAGDVDPADRPMGDVDVLVPPGQREQAMQALADGGYRVRGEAARPRAALDRQVLFDAPQGVLIDLHWNIVTGGWRFDHVIAPDLDGIMARAVPVAVDGQPARVMGAEDQLLHLAMHLMLSGGGGRRWWRDLPALLSHRGPGIDWSEVVRRAGRWRVRTILWVSLDVAGRGSPSVLVPPAVVRALRPAWWRRVALRGLLPRGLATDERESRLRRHLRELLLMDGAPEAARVLWRWLWPPAEWHRFRRAILAR